MFIHPRLKQRSHGLIKGPKKYIVTVCVELNYVIVSTKETEMNSFEREVRKQFVYDGT